MKTEWTAVDELQRWQTHQTGVLADAVRGVLAEVEGLRAELEIAQKFHDVAVKERDLARHQVERLGALVEMQSASRDGHPTMCCGQCADTVKQAERERDEALKKLAETEAYWEECQTEHHKRNLEVQRLKAELVSACDDLKKLGHNDCATRHEEALTGGRER